jgi:hypothetical protein
VIMMRLRLEICQTREAGLQGPPTGGSSSPGHSAAAVTVPVGLLGPLSSSQYGTL